MRRPIRVGVRGVANRSQNAVMARARAIGGQTPITGRNKCPETSGEGDAKGSPSPLEGNQPLVLRSKTALTCSCRLWSGGVSHSEFPHTTTPGASAETCQFQKHRVSFRQDPAASKDGTRPVSRHRFLPHDYRQQPVPSARLDPRTSCRAVSVSWYVGIGCDRWSVGIKSHHSSEG